MRTAPVDRKKRKAWIMPAKGQDFCSLLFYSALGVKSTRGGRDRACDRQCNLSRDGKADRDLLITLEKVMRNDLR